MLKKLIFIIYIAVLIVMGTATFVENSHTTDYAHEHIYGAWWFVALWGALALCGLVYYAIYLKKTGLKKLLSLHSFAQACLHLSFLLILGGALQTYLNGFNGIIHLRYNLPQDIMLVHDRGKYFENKLPFTVELNSFEMKKDDEGKVIDFITKFTICRGEKKEQCIVSMNNIYKYHKYRFYQSSYDDDLRGSVLSINHDYYGILITYCGYFLLFLSFLLLAWRNLRLSVPVIALTLLWCLYYFVLDGSWKDVPVLRHPLLAVHVGIIMTAYALLLVMAIKSAYWLIKKQPAEKRHAPDNKELIAALGFLSAGIFIGAIWANVSWGNYWSWDSKETWALITLLLYAVPAHRRSLPVFNNAKVYHAYILLAFLSILMTYFGVNYFLTGLHSYA